MAADWNAIKSEYITTDTSYRKLAEKYGLSRIAVGDMGKKEGWVELRRQHLAKALSKSLEKDIKTKADRLSRINKATDRLLEKVEQAIDELDLIIVKSTRKEKVIEYDNRERPDKPTREVISEEEEIGEVSSIIDRNGLKLIASALRDIKEVQMLKSEMDDQEQEARIANLRKMAEKDEGTTEPVRVVMGTEAEDYSN